MPDGGHSERSTRSLRHLGNRNVTVSDFVSTTQLNTSRRVSQFVTFRVDKMGGSDAPRSPSKRNGPTRANAPPSYSGNRPATTASQLECCRPRNTVRRNSCRYYHLHRAQAESRGSDTAGEPPDGARQACSTVVAPSGDTTSSSNMDRV